MAADERVPDDQCRPCRGTGTVISGLGGTPREVTCPWCSGTGTFEPGRNAQETGAELRSAAA